MLAKIKSRLFKSKFGKWVSAAAVSSFIAVMGCLAAFAADGETQSATEKATAALQTAFNTLSDTLISYVLMAVPIAMGVIVVVVGIKMAIRFFTSLVKTRG